MRPFGIRNPERLVATARFGISENANFLGWLARLALLGYHWKSCWSQGKTQQEAMDNIEEAIHDYLHAAKLSRMRVSHLSESDIL